MFLDFGDANGFCASTAGVFQFIGQIVTIFKIVIPVILIVLGVISFGKAVIAADDKEIKTATNLFIKKFIAAVIIFFIPNIVSALFSMIGSFSDVEKDYNVCVQCITSPKSSACTKNIK
ncbi:MAG: hypothetical protein E7164_04065 [Firmicutes bacterium]|nr:hypothetical protein [Bacillota bacterium]